MLGRHIRALAWCRLEPRSGRSVHDDAAPGGEEMRELCTHAQENATQIDGVDTVPGHSIHLVDALHRLAHTGVVDGPIEPAVGRDGEVDQRLGILFGGHIDLNKGRCASGRLDLLHDPFAADRVEIGHDNRRGIGRKLLRRCFTDAGAGSGHSVDTICKSHWPSIWVLCLFSGSRRGRQQTSSMSTAAPT